MEATKITKENILQELGAIAFARATDIIAVEGGQLVTVDTGALTGQQACAIASVEKGTGGLKVNFYDKLKALELLGKAVGLFEGGAQMPEDNGLLEAILQATKSPMESGELSVGSGK